MNASELRSRYQRFFEERGHRRIPSAPLLPENDPTVLFTTAGMHPLVPYLLGEPHPLGTRLVNVQKCIRTNDIAEVGDRSHLTFFEMLGNWSLGDYFKADSLAWSYEFLTRELAIDPRRLAVTVFAGDDSAPRDDDSAEIWEELGIPRERIFFLPRADNWWGPAGATGPCGPDSEMFFNTAGLERCERGELCGPGCPCGRWLEIWNNVFMEYEKRPDGSYARLPRRNVDTGMGLERTLAVLHGEADVFNIETLRPLVEQVEALSGRSYADDPAPFRVIADHVRAATFAIGDGARPSNVEAGYVVRRLVRRAVRYGRQLGIQDRFCAQLSGCVVDLFADVYPGLPASRERIASVLDEEEHKFQATLERGLRQFELLAAQVQARGEAQLTGVEAFNLFETHGLPLEMTEELAAEQGLSVDRAGFDREFERHQQVSRQGMEVKFKGGLADHSEQTTRLHTASHLLQAALRQVLGPHVHQMGSNITVERLRFDFSHPERLTDEQLAEVERIVNAQIEADLPVSMQVLPLDQALEAGALAFFSQKYGEQVKVYSIGDFSKEVCGGPHVDHTAQLGRFQITKQEAVGQGVRRIRAELKG
jgi:alanyl-tRNA synthetase